MCETSRVFGFKIVGIAYKLLGLSQKGYISNTQFLTRYTLSEKGRNLSLSNQWSHISKVLYANAIYNLIYDILYTIPDIDFDVRMVSRFQSNPGLAHW